MKEARAKREDARKLLAEGIDPGAQRRAVKAAVRAGSEHAYEVIAREWYAKQAPGWSESNRVRVLARQENELFPLLGARPISQITAPELPAALRRIEGRGAVDTAHRALQGRGRIFRYAVATGRAERDPAADLRGAPAPARSSSSAGMRVSVLHRQAVQAYKKGEAPETVRRCVACDTRRYKTEVHRGRVTLAEAVSILRKRRGTAMPCPLESCLHPHGDGAPGSDDLARLLAPEPHPEDQPHSSPLRCALHETPPRGVFTGKNR